MEPLLSSLCHYLQTRACIKSSVHKFLLTSLTESMQTVIDLKEKFRNSSTNRDVVAAGEQIMEMDYWRFQSLKR